MSHKAELSLVCRLWKMGRVRECTSEFPLVRGGLFSAPQMFTMMDHNTMQNDLKSIFFTARQ